LTKEELYFIKGGIDVTGIGEDEDETVDLPDLTA